MTTAKRSALLCLVLSTALGSQACVKKSTYRGVMDELADARADHQGQVAALRAEQETLQARLDSVEAVLTETRRSLRDAEEIMLSQRTRIETEAGQRRRLEEVLQETGQEAEQLRERIRALSAVEVEVRQRNQIYEDMLSRFRGLIDGGQLSVSISRGRMVLQLPQDVLFASGSATLNTEGTETLGRIGTVLAELTGRRFQVEGHTDDVPIATERFPSNWELSTGRALSVVGLLVRQGVPSENLSGAGFGEYQPVASNDTPEGRRSNRRIEIVMLPNLDLLTELGGPSGP